MLQARPEVELVFILSASELHASQAIQCLEAGKHVMIEKPMALSLPDVASVEAARQASGKVALVGYMRRYAEGFLRVKEMIRGMPKDEINHVRVRNFTYRVSTVRQSRTILYSRAPVGSLLKAGPSPNDSRVRPFSATISSPGPPDGPTSP